MGIEADGGWNIVNFGGISQPASEGGEANARLIAAAPDMIEALIKIVELGEGISDPTEEVEIAKRAIEKATGKNLADLMEEKR
jgi:hypothetical protein